MNSFNIYSGRVPILCGHNQAQQFFVLTGRQVNCKMSRYIQDRTAANEHYRNPCDIAHLDNL